MSNSPVSVMLAAMGGTWFGPWVLPCLGHGYCAPTGALGRRGRKRIATPRFLCVDVIYLSILFIYWCICSSGAQPYFLLLNLQLRDARRKIDGSLREFFLHQELTEMAIALEGLEVDELKLEAVQRGVLLAMEGNSKEKELMSLLIAHFSGINFVCPGRECFLLCAYFCFALSSFGRLDMYRHWIGSQSSRVKLYSAPWSCRRLACRHSTLCTRIVGVYCTCHQWWGAGSFFLDAYQFRLVRSW